MQRRLNGIMLPGDPAEPRAVAGRYVYLFMVAVITLLTVTYGILWLGEAISVKHQGLPFALMLFLWLTAYLMVLTGIYLFVKRLAKHLPPVRTDDYQTLKRSKTILVNMFHGINGLLIVITPNGIIQSLNNPALVALGYTKDELMGKPIDTIIHKKSSPFNVNWYDDFFDKKNIPYMETEFKTKKGRLIPILFSATAIGGDTQKFKNIVCMGLPLSAKQRSEIAIKKSDERYRNFMESIDQSYYEIDLSGRLVFFNNALCRLLGYSHDDLMSRQLDEFTSETQAIALKRTFERVYETGQPEKGFIWEFIHKDGSIRKIGASISLMRDETDKPSGFRGVARDITNRLLLESQLTQAQKLESIGQLAAGIAHEINTPIQYIQDNTLFLQDAFNNVISVLTTLEQVDRVSNDSVSSSLSLSAAIAHAFNDSDIDYYKIEIPKAIEQSLEGLERVSSIVSAMRIFAHPGDQEKTPIDINKTIQAAITVSRNEWKYNADMITEFDTSLPLVLCLPAEFNQVILNIIINAAQAISGAMIQNSPAKGRITISTRSYGRWVEICIADTGPGIPTEIQSRIFDPFFTTKDVGQGTGQGLALAHSIIVNKHGGTIRFETEEGRGTKFYVCLPLTNISEPSSTTETGS